MVWFTCYILVIWERRLDADLMFECHDGAPHGACVWVKTWKSLRLVDGWRKWGTGLCLFVHKRAFYSFDSGKSVEGSDRTHWIHNKTRRCNLPDQGGDVAPPVPHASSLDEEEKWKMKCALMPDPGNRVSLVPDLFRMLSVGTNTKGRAIKYAVKILFL